MLWNVEARIDTTSLQLLEDVDLASLITPLGDRLKLQRNLSIWKKELSQADSEKRIDLSPMVRLALLVCKHF